MTDLRAAVERLLWTTMDHDGERFTLPADSDGRFAPAENLRELATLLSQPEPSSEAMQRRIWHFMSRFAPEIQRQWSYDNDDDLDRMLASEASR
jgi:hypothetical protein